MSNIQATSPYTHCINAKKVFDWIVHCSTIHIKCPIFIKYKIIKENICKDFYITNNKKTPIFIWNDTSIFDHTGTLSISNHSKKDSMIHVFANSELLFSIANGQTRSITLNKFKSLSVTSDCINDSQGRFDLTLHKKIPLLNDQNFDINKITKIDCFFTNECGEQVNPYSNKAIECKEVLKSGYRDTCKIRLSNGEHIFLEKVRIRKKGFIVAQLHDYNCCIGPIPFLMEECFYLCAPPNTTVICTIEHICCDANIVPSIQDTCFEIEISIHLKQNIKVLGNTNLLVNGHLVSQRDQNIC